MSLPESWMLETACPYCDYKLDAVTNVSGGHVEPSDGDVTVCFSCAQVLIFDRGVPRKLRAEELERCRSNEKEWRIVERTQAAIRSVDRSKMG